MLRTAVLSVLAVLAAAPAIVLAQDGAFEWENSTELSYAATEGNASTNAFAIASELTGSGGPNVFKLEFGAIRASTTTTTRTATGTVNSYQVDESSSSEPSAAAYRAKARYDRDFETAFVFAGAGWERNTFSGFNSRVSGVIGLGRTWVDGDNGHFKTDVGATYTIQKDVEPAPGADDGFAGVRVTIDAARNLTSTTEFTSEFIGDENVEQGGDYRADWTNAIAVTISEGLALKTSYQILYDHKPALVRVPLQDGTGTPTGEDVLIEGEKFDTVLTLALVISL